MVSLLTSVAEAFVTISFLSIGYVVSLVFYRQFLSPLAKVPGPRLAALSFWYERYYDVIKRGRYVFKIKDLHDQYGMSQSPPQPSRSIFQINSPCTYFKYLNLPGPIVRVTPVEVHIKDIGFLDNIFPVSNLRKRDKYWRQLRGLDVDMSTASTIPHELHRRRREALNPFFSQRNVIALEPMLRGKVTQLCAYFEDALQQANGEVVNLYDLYYAFARELVMASIVMRHSSWLTVFKHRVSIQFR
jgi:hypothetical protein